MLHHKSRGICLRSLHFVAKISRLITAKLVGGWTTHLKNISQNLNLPQIGVKIKNVWNHHLEKYVNNMIWHTTYRLIYMHPFWPLSFFTFCCQLHLFWSYPRVNDGNGLKSTGLSRGRSLKHGKIFLAILCLANPANHVLHNMPITKALLKYGCFLHCKYGSVYVVDPSWLHGMMG